MNFVEAQIVQVYKTKERPKRGQSAMVDVDLLVNSI